MKISWQLSHASKCNFNCAELHGKNIGLILRTCVCSSLFAFKQVAFPASSKQNKCSQIRLKHYILLKCWFCSLTQACSTCSPQAQCGTGLVEPWHPVCYRSGHLVALPPTSCMGIRVGHTPYLPPCGSIWDRSCPLLLPTSVQPDWATSHCPAHWIGCTSHIQPTDGLSAVHPAQGGKRLGFKGLSCML